MYQPISFPVGGGLDLITPDMAMKPGRAIRALNYEPVANGYRRFAGFERFDGRTAPSATQYWRLDFTAGDNNGVAPVLGQNIRDSSASGSVHVVGQIVAVVTTGGDWATDNASGYFIATNMTANLAGTTGWFSTTPSPVRNFNCTAQTLLYDFGPAQNAIYLAAAIALNRSLIQAVPGSGPIRGIWGYNGDIFAFRDDAGATAGVPYKASTAGWVAVPNLVRVDFNYDSATMTGPSTKILGPPYGTKQVVTNTSGGASKGTIESVIYTGTVGTITTGYMLLSGYVAGTWTAAAQQIWIGATRAGTTTAAATTAAAIPPGGRYFFMNHNFYGSEDRTAMYMVNGVGNALVYNGVGYSPIVTGMIYDKPTRLAEHRNALFLAFPGGSLQSSEIGEPLSFDPILGASEIGVGSEITDLIPANQSTLLILAKRSISALYGNDATDYQLEKITEAEGDETVALPYTAQRVGTPIYMDNVGLRSINATPNYGNFNLGSISRAIEPLLRNYREQGINPVASLTWKRKDQYWIFFSNGSGLVVYLGMKEPQILPLNLGFTVSCASTVTINGVERAFVGTSTGYVMELDKGTSFDGAVIEHYIRFPFNSFKAPKQVKNFGQVTAGLETYGTTTLSVSADLNNGDGSEPAALAQQFVVTSGGSTLVDANTSESFYTSQIAAEAVADLGCEGKTISLKISGSTSTEQPHTITELTFYVSPRGIEQ